MKIRKKLAPIYYRYFRAETSKGASLSGVSRVAIVSFVYMLANGALTSFVAQQASEYTIFASALFLFLLHPFHVRIMAYAKYLGLIIAILFSALGYTVGTQIF